ncbi:MAG: hypothetical protein J1E29_04045 [Duncaniella sp.]|nr:hypothetical protein [Duncaniella sp.]
MTDAEFDELWRKSKERDLRDLSYFLNRWSSMTMIEKENYVIQMMVLSPASNNSLFKVGYLVKNFAVCLQF